MRPTPTSTAWTPARVAEAIALWRTGYSAGVIAKRLGTTRGAVLGKLWRTKAMDRKTGNPHGDKRLAWYRK